ncbi:hypothetical protein WSM22_40590 [Cytophagales bacterium WSM2-2]|nr:hypothetical protein WSM22_40590 [Cytophagales bacterium WSM2-2]
MTKALYSLILSFFSVAVCTAQQLPEYVNSATAWNGVSKQSVALTPEEGIRKDKAMIGKAKVIMLFRGEKSQARIKAQDTLKIYVNIDKETNPQGLFKIYKSTVVKGNREVLVMQTSVGRGVERFDGDHSYTAKKLSPGIFVLNIPEVKAGEELFFYIGTHETSLAKLTLGID